MKHYRPHKKICHQNQSPGCRTWVWQTMIKKNKLYINQQNPTYPFRKNNKEENWLTYPSFGEELETRVDIELSSLYIGFWGLWSRRRRAWNGIKMGSCLRIQKVWFVWKPWFLSWSCFWVWEAEQLTVKSKGSHSHWERDRESEREGYSHRLPLPIYPNNFRGGALISCR